jgi:hypothetical protein
VPNGSKVEYGLVIEGIFLTIPNENFEFSLLLFLKVNGIVVVS